MKKIRSALISLLAVLALSACGSGMSASAANVTSRGPIEHGTVIGWQDGDAVVYATVGFFPPNPQIVMEVK